MLEALDSLPSTMAQARTPSIWKEEAGQSYKFKAILDYVQS